MSIKFIKTEFNNVNISTSMYGTKTINYKKKKTIIISDKKGNSTGLQKVVCYSFGISKYSTNIYTPVTITCKTFKTCRANQ